jgi:hypothetical protein
MMTTGVMPYAGPVELSAPGSGGHPTRASHLIAEQPAYTTAQTDNAGLVPASTGPQARDKRLKGQAQLPGGCRDEPGMTNWAC